MPEPNNEQAPDSGVIEGPGVDPTKDETDQVMAALRAAAMKKAAGPSPMAWLSLRKPSLNKRTLLVIVLTTAILAGATGVGYGIYELRQVGQRQAEQEAARQREAARMLAEQRKAEQALAEQRQAAQALASQEASQGTAITEGTSVSARIAKLKALRSELNSIMDSFKKKARSSASAVSNWSRRRAALQASYNRRVASVRAHNANERRRYYASRVEVSRNGRLVVRYTYSPRYLGLPGRPGNPSPVRVSVDSEKRRLSALQSQVDALKSTLASEAPTAESFGSVYMATQDAAGALGSTVSRARAMARKVIDSRGSKGHIVSASKVSSVNLSALKGPFDKVDQSFSEALAAAGLTADQVAQ